MWLRKRENIMHIFSLNLALSLNQPFFFIVFASCSILFRERCCEHSTNRGRQMISLALSLARSLPMYNTIWRTNETNSHQLFHYWRASTSSQGHSKTAYFYRPATLFFNFFRASLHCACSFVNTEPREREREWRGKKNNQIAKRTRIPKRSQQMRAKKTDAVNRHICQNIPSFSCVLCDIVSID